MALKLVWTEDAVQGMVAIANYIEFRFGRSTAKRLVQRVEKFAVLLSELPSLGSLQDADRNIRGVIVNKRSTVVYTFNKNSLIILNVFDNRMPLD
ncbi:type II toxin-antitoxin system RelE/ParE family toxin [Arcticibacterium luteifluviistationis]|uniref:Type II toxin-antitoxin system RelE/ParE family toxin n=1 Tax=Arcticibacterium luteifluviistationis TaxID=1784714 RepID=A0A2Z4G768_9BACT|nr:type II toxin-antitoxin system RelE/ParE family toxin [Arcticibacterium luteifluviistationis]AWV96920.1 hypothetical protein DJ013_01495 [Arcticibacterium luteifluviistationis]